MHNNDRKKDKSDAYLLIRQIGILTSVPFILVLGPVIGYFIGNWIDNKFDIHPYATFIMVVLGFVASIKETVRIIKEAAKE